MGNSHSVKQFDYNDFTEKNIKHMLKQPFDVINTYIGGANEENLKVITCFAKTCLNQFTISPVMNAAIYHCNEALINALLETYLNLIVVHLPSIQLIPKKEIYATDKHYNTFVKVTEFLIEKGGQTYESIFRSMFGSNSYYNTGNLQSTSLHLFARIMTLIVDKNCLHCLDSNTFVQNIYNYDADNEPKVLWILSNDSVMKGLNPNLNYISRPQDSLLVSAIRNKHNNLVTLLAQNPSVNVNFEVSRDVNNTLNSCYYSNEAAFGLLLNSHRLQFLDSNAISLYQIICHKQIMTETLINYLVTNDGASFDTIMNTVANISRRLMDYNVVSEEIQRLSGYIDKLKHKIHRKYKQEFCSTYKFMEENVTLNQKHQLLLTAIYKFVTTQAVPMYPALYDNPPKYDLDVKDLRI